MTHDPGRADKFSFNERELSALEAGMQLIMAADVAHFRDRGEGPEMLARREALRRRAMQHDLGRPFIQLNPWLLDDFCDHLMPHCA